MSRRGVLAAAAALLLAPTLVLPVAEAATTLVEGEDAPRSGGCSGVATESGPQYSGGRALRVPGVGCWVEWDLVLPEPAHRLVLGGQAPAFASRCTAWEVRANGQPIGAIPSTCGPPRPVHLAAQLDQPVPAGPVVLRLTASGHAGANVAVDVLELDWLPPGCAADNAGPVFDGPVLHDGMGGALGWLGFGYNFSAPGVVDPDGDALRYRWQWGQEGTLEGAAAGAWTFAAAATHTVLLTVTDDPSPRSEAGCPPLTAKARSLALAFKVVPLLAGAAHLHPPVGHTCVAGEALATGLQAIVHSCAFQARYVTGNGQPTLGPPVDATFLLDGIPYANRSFAGAIFTVDFDGLQHFSTTFYRLEVCFAVPADRYGRGVCTPEPYVFLNVV